MRVGKILGGTLILACVALLVVALSTPHNIHLRPPIISLVSMEPAGIFDDMGKEMSLVTLCISNPNTPLRPENSLYVRDFSIPIEVKVTNVWTAVEGTLTCHLFGGAKQDRLCLLPAGADYSRFSLKYTGKVPIFQTSVPKGRLRQLVQRLPLFVRSRLPSAFWRWVGFGPDYGPSSNWRTMSVEIPLWIGQPPVATNLVTLPQ